MINSNPDPILHRLAIVHL